MTYFRDDVVFVSVWACFIILKIPSQNLLDYKKIRFFSEKQSSDIWISRDFWLNCYFTFKSYFVLKSWIYLKHWPSPALSRSRYPFIRSPIYSYFCIVHSDGVWVEFGRVTCCNKIIVCAFNFHFVWIFIQIHNCVALFDVSGNKISSVITKGALSQMFTLAPSPSLPPSSKCHN